MEETGLSKNILDLIYEPIEAILQELEQLRSSQLNLQSNVKLTSKDILVIDSELEGFKKVPEYVIKLHGIKKDMMEISERASSLVERAKKIKDEKHAQRQKDDERKRQLTAKLSSNLTSNKKS
ncbi:uncharacterized protein LOC126326546 isoform X2 [Schistocerca gregaria]|uniref:uncharacterized protein LOC126326546 isoform X2 n=1 Tax=Schistocerca gregaria TaxID=7010 RepID=UPI00211F1439|nr:uncharacterized protein LOC126326546 isoform X2 [Schistocerca gregaria]